jgi:hypothetical protein
LFCCHNSQDSCKCITTEEFASTCTRIEPGTGRDNMAPNWHDNLRLGGWTHLSRDRRVRDPFLRRPPPLDDLLLASSSSSSNDLILRCRAPPALPVGRPWLWQGPPPSCHPTTPSPATGPPIAPPDHLYSHQSSPPPLPRQTKTLTSTPGSTATAPINTPPGKEAAPCRRLALPAPPPASATTVDSPPRT